MADEKNKNATDDDLNLDISAEETESPKQSSAKGKLILIATTVTVLLAVAGTTIYFLMGQPDNSKNVAQQNEQNTIKQETAAIELAKQKAIYIELEPSFDVRIKDSNDKKHYLQINITLMTRDEKLAELIKVHKPLITNDLLDLLASQNYDELVGHDGKQVLREKALTVVKGIVQEQTGKDNIEAVLFTKFVME